MVMCAHYIPTLSENKGIIAVLLTTICTIFPCVIIGIVTLSLPDRDRNMKLKGYQQAIEQKWTSRIDTVYIPKSTK